MFRSLYLVCISYPEFIFYLCFFFILDAISLTMPKWIDNDIIGCYFWTFQNTHYQMNG